jgi:hypothetical protein
MRDDTPLTTPVTLFHHVSCPTPHYPSTAASNTSFNSPLLLNSRHFEQSLYLFAQHCRNCLQSTICTCRPIPSSDQFVTNGTSSCSGNAHIRNILLDDDRFLPIPFPNSLSVNHPTVRRYMVYMMTVPYNNPQMKSQDFPTRIRNRFRELPRPEST